MRILAAVAFAALYGFGLLIGEWLAPRDGGLFDRLWFGVIGCGLGYYAGTRYGGPVCRRRHK